MSTAPDQPTRHEQPASPAGRVPAAHQPWGPGPTVTVLAPVYLKTGGKFAPVPIELTTHLTGVGLLTLQFGAS
jgi:hypothetical protein